MSTYAYQIISVKGDLHSKPINLEERLPLDSLDCNLSLLSFVQTFISITTANTLRDSYSF